MGRRSRSESDDSSREHSRHKHPKKEEHKKKRKKKQHSKEERKRKKRRYSSSSSDDSYEDRKRRHKESKKRRKEKRSKVSSSDHIRRHPVVEALHSLLQDHPLLASDLPVMLIGLVNGTSFDLRSMTDQHAAYGLEQVFVTLEEYGVTRDTTSGVWTWRVPPGAKRDELVLVRVLRDLLDDAGVTMEAINAVECRDDDPVPSDDHCRDRVDNSTDRPASQTSGAIDTSAVEKSAMQLLGEFKQGDLSKELAGLLNMIMQGESVSLDALPDVKLRRSLEDLLQQMGLEKAEMLDEDDNDDDNDDEENNDQEIDNKQHESTLGYSLPDDTPENAMERLQAIINICEKVSTGEIQPKRPIRGPLLPSEAAADLESSDDEGPLAPGTYSSRRGMSMDQVRTDAIRRDKILRGVKEGLDAADVVLEEGKREQWMVDPGRFDFLSAVKAGHSIRNRGFQNKKAGGEDVPEEIDPAVRAELDAILQQHAGARGPSLLDQHRESKAQRDNEKSDKKGWNWNRDKDLDAGRRVDKEALNLIFGGAAGDLKEKFQGGFTGGN